MEEWGNWSGNIGISIDEAAIKIGKAKEDLDIIDGGRDRPFYDSDNIVGFYGNTIERNDETEEGDGGSVEATFFELVGQSKIAKPWQNFLDIYNMLLKYVGINEDIVEIYKAKNIQKIMEAIICICLKECGGISNIEGHDQIFKNDYN